MESPYYEMTHDFEEENRSFQSGYIKGYNDAMMKFPSMIVRCKDCKYWYFADNRIPCEQENVCGRNGIVVTPDWFCADGERRTDDARQGEGYQRVGRND